MQRKIKINRFIIGTLLVVLGILIYTAKYTYNNYLEIKEEREIEYYFKQNSVIPQEESNSNERKSIYIGVLEIPKISLKKGLVSKDSRANNVKNNIQILDKSEMPNVENSILALAGHSGNSNKSFFKNLYQVSYDDEIIVYYNNIKYSYNVIDIYVEERNGNININYGGDMNIIVLTTCAEEKDRQLVVIGELTIKEELK